MGLHKIGFSIIPPHYWKGTEIGFWFEGFQIEMKDKGAVVKKDLGDSTTEFEKDSAKASAILYS